MARRRASLSHHSTGVAALKRRRRLISIAEQYRFSIIEDDYDHDYNFDAPPLLPMAGFSPENVVYIGSASMYDVQKVTIK